MTSLMKCDADVHFLVVPAVPFAKIFMLSFSPAFVYRVSFRKFSKCFTITVKS